MRNFIIIILLVVFNIVTATSQIIYGPNTLSINANNTTGTLRINDFNRTIWKVDSLNFFAIDLSTAEHTNLYGSNNCINFYDIDNDIYYGLFSEGTYIMSDSCAKSDIKDLNGDYISNIIPVSFKWKDKNISAIEQTTSSKQQGVVHFGFIAQDLLEIAPEVVSKDDFGNLMVNYHALVPILIKSLQQAQEKILQQTNEIEKLLTELSIYTTN